MAFPLLFLSSHIAWGRTDPSHISSRGVRPPPEIEKTIFNVSAAQSFPIFSNIPIQYTLREKKPISKINSIALPPISKKCILPDTMAAAQDPHE